MTTSPRFPFVPGGNLTSEAKQEIGGARYKWVTVIRFTGKERIKLDRRNVSSEEGREWISAAGFDHKKGKFACGRLEVDWDSFPAGSPVVVWKKSRKSLMVAVGMVP